MSWDKIPGQELAKRILQAHLAGGRVAHAYLLAGPDRAQKRGLAIELAKALNCAAEGAKPCDACATCSQITRGMHPDVHVLSPAGASETVRIEPVRQLLGRIALRPFNAAFQVAIIDEAEHLTEEAANSLLKSIEEPPSRTRFVLTTSRLSDCLPTIVSRCHLVRCQPPPSAAQSAGPKPVVCPERPLPDTRQEVAALIEEMIAWLRNQAAAGAGAADIDRCIETALELVTLRDSLEQFVSPRLVASLAREKWLGLVSK